MLSSVAKKFVMAASGLALVGFVIVHLLGNLALYLPEGATFNAYAERLHGFGLLLTLAELGLLGVVLVHVVSAVLVTASNRRARPVGYEVEQTKGGPSLNTLASRNMIVSGLALLVFIALHVWQFRFGPGMEAGYVASVNGQPARDLHRLVLETFHQPLYVFIYVGAMLFLAAHLRHGFWSAFQSLGAMQPRFSKCVYAAGFVLAGLLALGFLGIPLWIFWRVQ